jgi:hypothetical protein
MGAEDAPLRFKERFHGQGNLFQQNNSLLRPQKFPVPLSREFPSKPLNLVHESDLKGTREAGIGKIPC